MLDPFLILTPVLVLAIVALLGFVGCSPTFVVLKAVGVQHVQTTISSHAPGTDTGEGTATISADLLGLQGGELLIATVQWQSPQAPILTGANWMQVTGGGPFLWNNMSILSYWATNPQASTSVSAEAILNGGSNVTWNLCVSAYSGAASATAPYSPEASDPAYTGPTPTAPAISLGPGDMLYAVGFAADPDGTFPGSTSLTAGPSLTAEFPAVKYPLVEDGGSGIISAQVTSNNPSAEGFIVAMGMKGAA